MSLDKHLHIVTLDVPYPADYGGAIEQFYKIVALHKLGIKIHLHCFTRKRPEAPELEQYCVSVNYYPRKTGVKRFPIFTPYIVASRSEPELLTNLQKDNYPVLFEGIHTTFLLQTNLLKGRKVLVRIHNCEYRYYKELAKHETSPVKKIYFHYESFLLKKYEKRIAKRYPLIAMSEKDQQAFLKTFKAKEVHYVPAFAGWQDVTSLTGKGCFCLYHGNLSVNENEEAANWLLKEVFNDINIPLVIAGQRPSAALEKSAHQNEHTCLVANPGEKELEDMIGKAQLHVLPSFNNTGIKLKLLHALYKGRYCIVNDEAVEGSGLAPICTIGKNTAEFKKAVVNLYNSNFDDGEIEKRKLVLDKLYNNDLNAAKIAGLFWENAGY